MKEHFKKYWVVYVIIVVVILLIVALVWYGKTVWDNIKFENFSFSGADFHGLALSDFKDILISGQSKNITVTLGIDIKNDNNFSIPFCYLKAKILYKGQLIATTSKKLEETCYDIPANGVLPVTDTIQITLNQAGAGMLIDRALQGKATLDYEIELKALGLPSWMIPTIRNNYTW